MMTKETFYIILFFCLLALLAFGMSTLVGWLVRVIFGLQHNYGFIIGIGLVVLIFTICLYGCTAGFNAFRVHKISIAFEDLPKEFDGYKIVHLTDAHLGSFNTREHLFRAAVDSILAQNADLIVFTGDIQNHDPDEIRPYLTQMTRITAPDGVYAVLGNHDYGYPRTVSSPLNVRKSEKEAGWNVLLNEHTIINKGKAKIVLAGMDNDGDGERFPQRGNVNKTLKGTAKDDFIIMLEHDPTSWKRNIIKHSHTQLTLSGHTHAMQFMLFGWSPSKWFYNEWLGLYSQGTQHLYVSGGIGGVLSFRFNMPREIVVIELKSKKAR